VGGNRAKARPPPEKGAERLQGVKAPNPVTGECSLWKRGTKGQNGGVGLTVQGGQQRADKDWEGLNIREEPFTPEGK